MKTNLIAVTVTASIALTLASCATLFTKSNQDIMFKGVPGTTITDENKNQVIGEIGHNGFTTIPMKKQLAHKDVKATKDGYVSKEYRMDTKIQPWFWGNIVLGGIVGGSIDAATGKMKKFKNDVIDLTLTPAQTSEINEYEISRPPLKQEERVTRNNPGATDMEKAIIRWYFDSDPRGARVFYRVISSNPAEVKNTNETYLTTTPIEETRAFNIIGLTYENSADVTIEIKITKRGYHDQVKRYNVRQALDQQEISGFFELVPNKD